VRQAIGGALCRDHVARNEARDRRVGHAADDRLDQPRPVIVFALPHQPSSMSGEHWPTADAMFRRTGSS
jgi:hypothetical protein